MKNKAEEYFKTVSEIPHASGHEEWLADYLEYFAKEHGLSCHRDDMHNVIIYAKATENYENHEPVILQASLDMLCDVEPGYAFDFIHQPLELVWKKQCVYARHTTLGAESSAGIAVILAILDENLPHPPLTCVFTAQSHDGFAGAKKVSAELSDQRMVSFTGTQAHETIIASDGSRDVRLSRVLHPVENHDPAYKLSIYGLSGGDCADNIIRGHGNAAVIIARILDDLISHGVDVRLAKLEGGSQPTNIIMSAYAVFVSVTPSAEIENHLNRYFKALETEYKYTDHHMEMKFEVVEWNDCYRGDETEMIIQTISLAPYGVADYAKKRRYDAYASSNLGIVSTKNHLAFLHYHINAKTESERDHIAHQILTIGHLFNMSGEEENDIRKWHGRRFSEMRKTLRMVHRHLYDKNIRETVDHGSLEASVFLQNHSDLDIVTLGCDISHPGTYKESLDLLALDDLYQLTGKLLGEL